MAFNQILLTVIIPTHKRPLYLKRAIESVLTSTPAKNIEILVIPNGIDESWIPISNLYNDSSLVRFIPIPTPHANAARNHGLSQANGKYVRFLDDDDYLYEGSWEQIEALEKAGADICSGRVENVTERQEENHIILEPIKPSKDFIAACILPSSLTLPVGNVYKTESIKKLKWREDIPRYQDAMWLLDLAHYREWRWIHIDAIAGAYVNHEQHRISNSSWKTHKPYYLIENLFDLHKKLSQTNRLTNDRSNHIAIRILDLSIGYFSCAPQYWTITIFKACSICNHARPTPIKIKKNNFLKSVILIPLIKAIFNINTATKKALRLFRDF